MPVPREVVAGAKVGETCRTCTGMGAPQMARMRNPEQKNARLKKMYAEPALVQAAKAPLQGLAHVLHALPGQQRNRVRR